MEKKKDIIFKYNTPSYVEIYDNRYKRDQYKKMDSVFENIKKIESHDLILDYGCGTGLFWDYLCDMEFLKIWKGNLLGIDISYEMLRKFVIKFNSNDTDLNRKIKSFMGGILCCDGENLPLRENIFDQVHSYTALQNLPNIGQGLEEINRVKKKMCNIVAISFLKKSKTLPEITGLITKNLNQLPSIVDIKDLEDWIFII